MLKRPWKIVYLFTAESTLTFLRILYYRRERIDKFSFGLREITIKRQLSGRSNLLYPVCHMSSTGEQETRRIKGDVNLKNRMIENTKIDMLCNKILPFVHIYCENHQLRGILQGVIIVAVFP